MTRIKATAPFRLVVGVVLLAFVLASPGISYAQLMFDLPGPGAMVWLTSPFSPPLIKGLTIHPENPLQFDFLIDPGDVDFKADTGHDKAEEYRKLIKYFLAALTVPEEDLWVNLSPYEKDRIIPENFGKTEMGRDLLGQDYILKQLTASLMYPEKELGKEFWQKVYQEARARFGTTEIPVNTFNKVWIVADKASVYEHGNTVFLVDSHLKVMLEEDYLALEHNSLDAESSRTDSEDVSSVSSQVIREVILPAIEKEVNEGKNFALLRQINNSLILAVWYKTTLKESLLGKVYADRSKTEGVDQDIKNNQKIYEQYLEAFKKGVYNYIKEDYDPITQEMIPRKYFSGGFATEDPSLDNPKTPENEGFLSGRIETVVSGQHPELVAKAIKEAAGMDEVKTNFQEFGGSASPEEQSGSAASPLTNEEEYLIYREIFPGLIEEKEGKYYVVINLINNLFNAPESYLTQFSMAFDDLESALAQARKEEYLIYQKAFPGLIEEREGKYYVTINLINNSLNAPEAYLTQFPMDFYDLKSALGRVRVELLTLRQPSLEEVLKKFIRGAAVILRKTGILPGKQSPVPPSEVIFDFLKSDIREGERIILSQGGQTSAIKKIGRGIDANTLELQTDTSIYEVKILTDITDQIIHGERKLEKGDILGKNDLSVSGIVIDSDPLSGELTLKIRTKDGVSEGSVSRRDMQDKITMGEFRAWSVGGSSPIDEKRKDAWKRGFQEWIEKYVGEKTKDIEPGTYEATIMEYIQTLLKILFKQQKHSQMPAEATVALFYEMAWGVDPSNLIESAKLRMDLGRVSSLYGDSLRDAVAELLGVLRGQDHSGHSYRMTLDLFKEAVETYAKRKGQVLHEAKIEGLIEDGASWKDNYDGKGGTLLMLAPEQVKESWGLPLKVINAFSGDLHFGIPIGSAASPILSQEQARQQFKAFLQGPNGHIFEAKMGAGRLRKAEPIAIELLRELHGKPLSYKIFDTTFTKGDITTEPEVTLTNLADKVGRVELSTFMQVVFLRMLGITQRPDVDSGELPREETSDRIKIGNTNVGIVQGDITGVRSDAVVPAVNTGMLVGRGVTRAIMEAVGYDNAAKVFPPPRMAIGKNSFKVGDAYVASLEGIPTRAGWKYVISAMIHTAEPWGDPSADSVKVSTKKALEEANKRNLTSVTFPAFGTGILGMDFRVSARSMYLGIQEFLRENPQTSLRDIKVVLLDAEGLTPFRQELDRLSSPPVTLQASTGEDLHHFAAVMLGVQKTVGKLVQGEFNGVMLKATGKETVADIVQQYDEALENQRREAEAWKATPEGQEYLRQEAERKVAQQRQLTEAKAKYARMKQDILRGNERTKATVAIFNKDWKYISQWVEKIKGTVSENFAKNPNAANVHEVKNVDANMRFLFGAKGIGGRLEIDDQEVAAAIQEALWADLEDYFQTLKKAANPATTSSPAETVDFTKGGIDLNPANLNLQIKRDGNGVPLPVEFQDIPNINVNGFIPVIINITPVTNLPLLLGTKADPEEQQLSRIQ